MGQRGEAAEGTVRVEFVGGPKDGEWTDMYLPPWPTVVVPLEKVPAFVMRSPDVPSTDPALRTGRYALEYADEPERLGAIEVRIDFLSHEVLVAEEWVPASRSYRYVWDGED